MSNAPELLRPPWFFAWFAVFWSAICVLLSYLSGWRSLVPRFADGAPIEGERFRFVSGGMGSGLPVSYRGCLFVTVGRFGFSLSLWLPFRILCPELRIPWSEVKAVKSKKLLWMRRTEIELCDSNVRLTLLGPAGERLRELFASSNRGDSIAQG
ncbi:MAG TPA: hypothetical protein VMR86_21065 [Myxococcota bacterium]|nr:hypothetical protein [Myxococcota bacterium]